MIRHLLLPSILVGTLVQGLAFAQPPGGSLVTPPPLSQTQHEQLAKMPADVRIYEEFRYWSSFQSPDVQKAALEHYVIALERQGVAPAERASRIAVIRERGRQLEVDRWNRILTAERPTFNTQPNAFLAALVKGRQPGRALDVGMGQGRNAIFLAEQGWDVTGFDPAQQAVAAAEAEAKRRNVKLTVQIVGSEEFDWGTERWDLIVLSYVAARPYVEQIIDALAPGGLVVLEAFHRDATKQGSIGGGVVYDSNELLRLFEGLRVLRYEDVDAEADFGPRGSVTRTVRLAAQKR